MLEPSHAEVGTRELNISPSSGGSRHDEREMTINPDEAQNPDDAQRARTTGSLGSELRPIFYAYWYWWLVAIACLVLRFAVISSASQHALALAVLLLGVLIFVQFLLDLIWGNLDTGSNASRQEITAKTYTEGFRQAAATLIGVPGVVLGLLAVFGKPPFPLGLKVGAVSLILSLFTSILLLFFSSLDVPSAKGPLVFLGYLVNIIFWSLALGLLCITAVLLYASQATGGS